MGLYSKLIAKPLDSLDQQTGKIFKNLFYFVFKIASLGIAIYGAYLLVSGLLGKTGYLTMLKSLDSFDLVRSIICLIFTFTISAGMFFSISAIFWKRANDFKTREFGGAVFLFPRFIKILGEAIAVIPVSAALISFFAIILSAIPYAPIESLGNLAGSIGSTMVNEFIGNTFAAVFIETASDYFQLLTDGFIGLITGFFMSIGVLFGTYIIAELFEIVIYFLIRKPLYN
ncbi:hypothetical protein [Salinivirga cyanobacteriivorans]|uniref:Uncharacterized protein n=1 Tax=Salinivirga cyanobacteriivorans TaxID=1307839 RepID=A0A0S2HVR5_9BACT|nr:hypothetical protein [Salinivirga cyanobacteriivorans]ALO14158.1 hypothetical protein L21SP5_00482 [Salinivirga cyanobacteriivorans]